MKISPNLTVNFTEGQTWAVPYGNVRGVRLQNTAISGVRNNTGLSTKSCVVPSTTYERLKRTVVLAISSVTSHPSNTLRLLT